MRSSHPLPARHPPDALLLDYAAGSLTEAPALVVATHLALCPGCRRAVSGYEALGGALLEGMEPAEMPAGALEAVLARLDDPALGRPDGAASAPAAPAPALRGRHRRRPVPVLPEPLRGYAGGDVAALGWQAVAEGVEEVDLRVGREGVRTCLLRLGGGARIPGRARRDSDPAPGPIPGLIPGLILVLAGALRDARGVHRRGDVLLHAAGPGPGPAAQPGGGCICLVVSGAPLRLGTPAEGVSDPSGTC